MSTKHLISPGIGFSPGSIKYIVTRGLIAGEVVEADKLDVDGTLALVTGLATAADEVTDTATTETIVTSISTGTATR